MVEPAVIVSGVVTTRYANVLSSLGKRIVEGELAKDSVLTLEWLGEEFGVSRTVAREVVQVLASSGLLESRRRTGLRVLGREHWNVFDPLVLRWRLAGRHRADMLGQLTQLRAAIEPMAAAMAARGAPEGVRARLVELADLLEEAGSRGDLATFLTYDVEFHRLLLVTSGNEMFAALGDVVEEVLRGRTEHDLMPGEPKPEARRLHAMVADAVAAGEPELAGASMTALCAEVVAAMSQDHGTR